MRQGNHCGAPLNEGWHTSDPTDSVCCWVAVVLAILLTAPTSLFAEEPFGVQPLLSVGLSESHPLLPPDTQLLIEARVIEQFLSAVDGVPPDWASVYGHGHHDSGLDERLFNLNRERDARRKGNNALRRRIAFVWSGELSTVDPESGGFRVVLGPKFTLTRWGLVRFKYEDLPGNLIAIPTADQRMRVQKTIQESRSFEIDVVMAGTLVPEESIVYDFSHDQEGLGLIMPVVRIDTLLYLLSP